MKIWQLTIVQKSTILGLYNAKVLGANIAIQLSMPKITICNVLKSFHMQGTMQSLKSIGRVPKLSAHDQIELGKILLQK